MTLIAFVLPVAYQAVAYEGRKAGLFWLTLCYNGGVPSGTGGGHRRLELNARNGI